MIWLSAIGLCLNALGTAMLFWDSCRKTLKLKGRGEYSVTLEVEADENDGLIRHMGLAGMAIVFIGFVGQLFSLIAAG